MAVVLAALAVALAPPLRQLLSQRSQIANLRASVATEKDNVAALQKTQKLWDDPKYVEAQARDRLHYVRPGQVPYVTLSPAPVASASAAEAALAAAPWYGRLWSSVQGASVDAHAAPLPSPTPALASSLVVASQLAVQSAQVAASEAALASAQAAAVPAVPTPQASEPLPLPTPSPKG